MRTVTISSVAPASGVPGTQVTITGSGFGAAQGSGQVWLGTANGLVQSWSDTQVVALVASGSTSGTAQVLQGGVVSNTVSVHPEYASHNECKSGLGKPRNLCHDYRHGVRSLSRHRYCVAG